MSDSYRKDFADKVHDTLKPDSQKSTYEKGKEAVTDTVDRAAAAITPTDKKGAAQEAADSFHDAKKDAQSAAHDSKKDAHSSGESYLDQAKDVVNSLANAASEKLAEARDFVHK